MDDKERLSATLKLVKHSEGGRFVELFRSETIVEVPAQPNLYSGPRCAGTAIHYMIENDHIVSWHKHVSQILYFWHRGTFVKIHTLSPEGNYKTELLGDHFENPEASYHTSVPHDHWYAMEVVDKTKYALFSGVVIPGFEFKDWLVGTKEDLLKLYPQHKEIVEQFAKE